MNDFPLLSQSQLKSLNTFVFPLQTKLKEIDIHEALKSSITSLMLITFISSV